MVLGIKTIGMCGVASGGHPFKELTTVCVPYNQIVDRTGAVKTPVQITLRGIFLADCVYFSLLSLFLCNRGVGILFLHVGLGRFLTRLSTRIKAYDYQ